MQCNSCGSKWESNNIVTKCPFCGANLAKAKDPNNMDISGAIESIIANQGIEVLKNTRLVNAHVMDLVRGHDRDKKLFRILCTNGAMEFAYTIAKTTDSSQKEVIIKKQIKVLVDNAFLAEDNAIAAINIILRGLGEKEIQATQTPSAQVIQSVTNSSTVREKLEAKFDELFSDLDDDLPNPDDEIETIILNDLPNPDDEIETIILNDENGEEEEFEFLDLISYEGEEYVVLLPIEDCEEAGEVVILRLEESGEEEEAYVSVDDDDILMAVFNIFKDRFKDYFNFVD